MLHSLDIVQNKKILRLMNINITKESWKIIHEDLRNYDHEENYCYNRIDDIHIENQSDLTTIQESSRRFVF